MDFDIRNIKHKKQLAVIGIVLLCVIVICSVFYSNVIKTASDYNEAMSMYKAYDYQSAQKAFEELSDYKDSAEYAEKCSELIISNKYNHAMSLYNSHDYDKAAAIFREIPNYKNSISMYEQCSVLSEKNQIYSKIDPQYTAYYNIIQAQFKEYGEPKVVKKSKKSYTVTGVNLLNLIDFDNDGISELVIGRRKNADDAGSYEIYAYYKGRAQLVYSRKYNKHAANKTFYAFETVKMNGSTGVYIGSKSSGRIKVFDGITFVDDTVWKKDNDTYTVNDKKVSKKSFNLTVPSMNYGRLVSSDTSAIDEYVSDSNSSTIYSTSYLTKSAAQGLKSRVESTASTLKESYDRAN